MESGDFSSCQKDSFTGRTLPVSVSTEARARLWDRRAGADGRRGGVTGEELPRWLDSSESLARESKDDLFRESLLELLRGKDLLRESLPASLFVVPLVLSDVLDRLLFKDSRLVSRVLEEKVLPVRLSRLESLVVRVVSDFKDSLLSFLPCVVGGFGAAAFVAPGKGIRLGRLRGDGFTSRVWWWSRADSVLLPGSG